MPALILHQFKGTPLQGTQLIDFITNHLEDMKARDIVVLDVSGLSAMTDKMVICSGNSSRHCRSIANNLLVEAKKAGLPYDAERHERIVQSLGFVESSYRIKIPPHWK